jgi:hypothetical protein
MFEDKCLYVDKTLVDKMLVDKMLVEKNDNKMLVNKMLFDEMMVGRVYLSSTEGLFSFVSKSFRIIFAAFLNPE